MARPDKWMLWTIKKAIRYPWRVAVWRMRHRPFVRDIDQMVDRFLQEEYSEEKAISVGLEVLEKARRAHEEGSFDGFIGKLGHRRLVPDTGRPWRMSLTVFAEGKGIPYHRHDNVTALHLVLDGLFLERFYKKDEYLLSPGQGYVHHDTRHEAIAKRDKSAILIWSLRGVNPEADPRGITDHFSPDDHEKEGVLIRDDYRFLGQKAGDEG